MVSHASNDRAFLNLNEEFTLKNPDAGESAASELVIKVNSLADDFSWIEFSVSGIESQSEGDHGFLSHCASRLDRPS